MSTQFCNGSAILANRHYKHIVFGTSENGCGALTLENITYPDCMEIMKNTISGRHFYDFETTSSGGEVTRLIEGAFIINKEVTR